MTEDATLAAGPRGAGGEPSPPQKPHLMPAPEPTTSASSDDIPTRIRAARGNFTSDFGTFDLHVRVQD
jgi:hypothetical protein